MNFVLRVDHNTMGLNLWQLHSKARLLSIRAHNHLCDSFTALISRWCEKATNPALSLFLKLLLLGNDSDGLTRGITIQDIRETGLLAFNRHNKI